MRLTKPIAYIFLILLIVIIVHSTVSLFQGKFVQASAMAPFLVVVYVFAVARKSPSHKEEIDPEEEKDGDEKQDSHRVD